MIERTEIIFDEKIEKHEIPFVAKTEMYGLAEFSIEPIIKRGYIREVIISPLQQPGNKNIYVIKNLKLRAWRLGSWTHKGIDEPAVWQTNYCPQHKGFATSFFVPRNANILEVNIRDYEIELRFDNL